MLTDVMRENGTRTQTHMRGEKGKKQRGNSTKSEQEQRAVVGIATNMDGSLLYIRMALSPVVDLFSADVALGLCSVNTSSSPGKIARAARIHSHDGGMTSAVA